MKSSAGLVIVCFCIVSVRCEIAEGQETAVNQLNEQFDKMKQEIPMLGNLPNVDPKNLPSVDQVQSLFQKKCEKNGGDFEKAKTASFDFANCTGSLINVTKVQEEIEESKKTGDLDTVFQKYCRRIPDFKQCIMNYTDAIEPCLEEKEKESKVMFMNITESLANFVCFKDGDRIAMFIAENGPDCIIQQQEGIQNCLNETFAHRELPPMPEGSSNLTSTLEQLPLLILGAEECSDMAKLQVCVVKELGKCSDPTPANIMESLFKFVIKVTPCGKMEERTHGGAGQIAVSFAALVVPLLISKYF